MKYLFLNLNETDLELLLITFLISLCIGLIYFIVKSSQEDRKMEKMWLSELSKKENSFEPLDWCHKLSSKNTELNL